MKIVLKRINSNCNAPKIFIAETNNFLDFISGNYRYPVSESVCPAIEHCSVNSTESLDHLTQANIDTLFHAMIDMHDYDHPDFIDHQGKGRQSDTNEITIDLQTNEALFANGEPIIGYEG